MTKSRERWGQSALASASHLVRNEICLYLHCLDAINLLGWNLCKFPMCTWRGSRAEKSTEIPSYLERSGVYYQLSVSRYLKSCNGTLNSSYNMLQMWSRLRARCSGQACSLWRANKSPTQMQARNVISDGTPHCIHIRLIRYSFIRPHSIQWERVIRTYTDLNRSWRVSNMEVCCHPPPRRLSLLVEGYQRS